MIGNRRYSRDLVQGGVEIPCKYTFTHDGQLKEVEKVEKFFGGLNSDDYVCSTVSTSTSSSILTEKRALDVEFIESSDDKRFKRNDFPSSSASLDLATDLTLPEEQDKANESKTAIDKPISNTKILNADQVWVKFRHNTEHKSLIEDGCRLTDKHIGFVSSLISHQFPRICGLRTTLLQTRYYCFPSESN